MPPFVLMLASMFAGPIGSMVNTAIKTGAASIITYSVAKGNPLGDLTNVVAAGSLALSTLLSSVAQTQGVHIPIINNDPTNGVKVVRADEAARRVDAPVYHGGPHG